MGDRQSPSFDRQACKDKCIVRSVSLPPHFPNFPLGDSTNHTALDVATLEPPGEANHNQRARDFHKMGDRQSPSFDRQACKDKCIVRSVSLPPHFPNFPLGDSTNHTALDVATLEPTGEANHNQRLRDCLALYRAALKGNWREAEDIIRRYPDDIIRASITEMGDTVLHIASATKHATFVKKVVESLSGKDLAQKNRCGDTAICIAAESGIVTIAEEMLNKNNSLILIRNRKKRTPLHAAALFGHRDMVAYLLPKTPFNNLTSSERMEMLVPFQDLLTPTERKDMLDAFKDLTPSEKMDILVATITHDMYDIAFQILVRDPTLATANNRASALRELARKPSAIGSRSQLSLWKSCLNSYITFKISEKEATLATASKRASVLRELAKKTSGIGSESQPSVWKTCLNFWFKRIFNKALMETLAHQLVMELSEEVQLFKDKEFDALSLLSIAAKVGNAEFLIILIRTYPDIMWITDSNNCSLFHLAVKNRQESVFNLIHEVVTLKEIILTKYDKSKYENILHLAGYLASPSRLNIVSGAALQMQRELLWFKEVKMIMLPSLWKTQNSMGLTPWDLFTTEHENLRRDGEKWMKDTANNCMLVATLITTVVFAAAFTVPGGNNQDTGIAIFHTTKWFRVFFISDAIALVFSSSSILIFLSILTSRFTEMDFLVSLPLKLLLGLTTLFISIVGMLVAFSATCFVVFKSEMAWFPYVIIILAVVAIFLFLWLHLPLCADIIRSTFFSRSLFRPRKKRLF